MSEPPAKFRLYLGAGVLMLAIVGLGCRLAFLHLGPYEQIRERAQNNQRIEKTITARRGNIYDSVAQANLLALSLPLKDVCVDPLEVSKSNHVAEVASALAAALNLDSSEVLAKISNPRKRFACIKRFVAEEPVSLISEKKFPGVFFQDSTVRQYPNRNFMCHVLGFVNYEGQGSAGLELSLDKFLVGNPGSLDTSVNALRQEVYSRRESYVPAIPGSDVYINLDQNVQYIAEKALDEVMAEHHAKGAWAIVQKVRTGEILALASRPSFDLNEFPSANKDVMMNRAIGCNYEPGSTFKAVVISAALNEGTVTPETEFDCENGSWVYAKRVLRDYHGYGRLTVADGLKKSSNILTAKVALTLGDERMYKYLKAYGIGDKMGIDLPGEERGILHGVSKWSGISATRISIGQGVAVTALQMLGVFCAIGNDGYMMRPYVVNRVVSPGGSVSRKTSPEVIARPISVETAATMRRLLSRVTDEGGTGIRAQVEGFEVAGKTGSAQKPAAGGYSTTAYVASFVGFLPADDPEIGLIVVVDEPQPCHLGGVVAGPVFSKIATQIVRYMDISPSGYSVANRGR